MTAPTTSMTAAAVTARPGHSLGGLLGATFVLGATNSIVFPLLGDLQKAHGLPTWSLGIISGTAFVVGLVTQLTLSGFADRGRARRLLLAGLALAVAGGLLFAVSTQLWEFVLARALGGMSVGCFIPAARAAAATLDEARVAQNLGRLASFELGGFVFGPVVAGALASWFGLRVPFLVFAGAAAVTLAVVATRPLPMPTHQATSSAPALSLLRRPGVRVATLLALALFVPVGVFDSLWARYLGDRGASTAFIGLSLALYGVPFVLLATRGGRLADRYGAVRSTLRTFWALVPLTALYGLVTVPLAIMSLALVEAVMQAVAVPGAQAAMAEACPPERAASGQGLAGATQLAGAGTIAFIAAPMYEAFGPAAVFCGVAALVGVIVLVAYRIDRRMRNSSTEACIALDSSLA
jgi:predicted MFS family arabinose efflux permease